MKNFGKYVGTTLGLVLLVALFSLLYLHFIGFPGFLKQFIVGQLERAGIAAQFGSLRLDLIRGVVATDAMLADARAPEHPLAEIDELEFRWNWQRLWRRQNAIQAIRIANATISVPTPPDEIGSERFTAENAYATFYFEEDGSILVDRLTGVYVGIHLHVTGRLKPAVAPPEPEVPAEPRPEPDKPQFGFITKVVRELNKITGTVSPELDLDFNVDLARPLGGRVLARLRGSALTYRGLHIDVAAVDVEMRKEAIQIQQCQIQLYRGEVMVSGRYDIAMGRFDLQLTSTTDPMALRVLLPPDQAGPLDELRFLANPHITARYTLSAATGSLPQLSGVVETGGLEFRGIPFEAIRVAYEYQGVDLKLDKVSVVMREGQLTGRGEFNVDSTDFAYELDSTLDPTKLLALMTPPLQEFFQPGWFDKPPRIIAAVRGDFVDPDAFAYDARVDIGRFSYRGVELEEGSAALRLREGRLEVHELLLEREEGDFRGELLADFNEHRVHFDVHTTANPTEMAGILGEKAAATMEPYRFGPLTTGQAKGVLDFNNDSATAWTATVTNDGFSWWKLTADVARANLVYTNNTLRIDDIDADIYGGTLRGRAEFAFANPTVTYRFELDTERCKVRQLAHALQETEGREVSGVLSAHAELRGHGDDLRNLKGTGNLEIQEGVLWAAPLFGIFSRILDELSPGLGMTKATRAKATFSIADAAARTDDLEVAAGAFTVRGRGDVHFDGKLDFRVQAQFLRAVPGINIATALLGKIFEYKIGGTLGDPSFRPTRLPKEILPHGD